MYEQPYNPYRNNIAIVKGYFKKPAVLALAIASIVSIIVGFVNSIISAAATNDFLQQLSVYLDQNFVLQTTEGDMGNEIVKALRDTTANPDTTTWVFSLPVLSILTVVGLLLLYFSSRKDDPNAAPMAGVTILNVIAVFGVVGSVLAVAGLLIVAVAFFVLYAALQSNSTRSFVMRFGADRVRVDATLMLVFAIVITVLAVIVGFFLLFYSINRKRYIGSIKRSLTSVDLSRNGARPYGVFSILYAVVIGVSLLSSIASLAINPTQQLYDNLGITVTSEMSTSTILSLVGYAIAFVIAILQAKIALGYAKCIDEQKTGYGNAPYAAGGYAPANADAQTQPYPYSNPVQPQAEEPAVKDDSFINPYLDDEKTMAASPTPSTNTICPSCGAKVESRSPFCGQCGKRL